MTTKKIFAILGISLLLLPLISNAQSNRWKRMRYEIFVGAGASNFLGELGGRDKTASHFIQDLELSLTRPALTIGGRYWLDSRLIFQSAFSWAYLWGDDSKTSEYFRNQRDLHFRTAILEMQGRLEYTLLASKRGHRYNLRKVRGRPGNKLTIDAYLGVCGFFFNPKQKIDGVWYALQPIGTEGQNFSETRKPYSRIQVGIPLGFQFKFLLNRQWSIGLDIGYRYTFTDYIDDVSTTYADLESIIQYNENENASPEVIRQIVAPVLYDGDSSNDSSANTYEQRGDASNNDVYMLVLISINHKLRTGRNGLPRFK